MTHPPGGQVTRFVLVHGSMSSAAQWADYPALLRGRDVVAVDLPGHGTRRRDAFTLGRAAAVLDEAGAGRPDSVLVGHSLGGYVAARYAAERHGPAGLVLIGATGDPGGIVAAPYRAFAAAAGRVPPRALMRVRLAVASRLGVRDALLPDAADYPALPAVWRAVAEACGPADVARVACPILLVNGRFDQMRVDERRYLRLAPTARLAVVPGATHLAPLTHPERVAELLRRFADDLSG